MKPQLEHIHSRIHAELRAAVGEGTYRIWLAPLRVEDCSNGLLVLSTPSEIQAWVERRFHVVLANCARAVMGTDTRVTLTDSHARLPQEGAGHRNPLSPQPFAQASTARHPSPPRPATTVFGGKTDLYPNPQLTFERFIIGECNRLAHGAALTVAEGPGQAFNPLFVCGPPGVGKTHLLHSIAAFLLTHNQATVVRLTASEAFTNEFLHALHTNHVESFKARFRHVDVLLLDDIQFLQRKTRTEEEFFHTFNALHDLGSQIVMTSDRTPQELKDLERRLRERFEGGLVADIKPPDPKTRTAILQKNIREQGIRLTDQTVIDLLADHITTSVRALEGALIRLVAVASLTGQAITTDLAAEVLPTISTPAESSQQEPPGTTITAIQTATCEHFGLSHADLLSTSRAHRFSWPRQLAMLLARTLTKESLPAIGRKFGGRDHTTVLYACRRVQRRIAHDPHARTDFSTLHNTLCHLP